MTYFHYSIDSLEPPVSHHNNFGFWWQRLMQDCFQCWRSFNDRSRKPYLSTPSQLTTQFVHLSLIILKLDDYSRACLVAFTPLDRNLNLFHKPPPHPWWVFFRVSFGRGGMWDCAISYENYDLKTNCSVQIVVNRLYLAQW